MKITGYILLVLAAFSGVQALVDLSKGIDPHRIPASILAAIVPLAIGVLLIFKSGPPKGVPSSYEEKMTLLQNWIDNPAEHAFATVLETAKHTYISKDDWDYSNLLDSLCDESELGKQASLLRDSIKWQ